MKDYLEIEKSIIKTYRSSIWAPFIKAIEEFSLIESNDKVLVCLSGGKDSLLLGKLFQQLKKHKKYNFECKFIFINPGFNKDKLDVIRKNFMKLNLDVYIENTDIFDSFKGDESCYRCALARRSNIYKLANKFKFNKIALGHHYNDIIETTLLNLIYNGKINTILPLKSSNEDSNLKIIRPMYFIKEDSIIRWIKYNQIIINDDKCPFIDNLLKDNQIQNREKIKNLIDDLQKINPNADKNIFNALLDVNLASLKSYNKEK